MDNKQIKSINYSMKLFSACAIVLVVVGHVSPIGFNGPFDMFKVYSFQVAAFVFVSGYFYKEKNEHQPFQYLWKKCKRLVLPLLLINAAYGVIAFALIHFAGLKWGGLIYR